MRHADRTVPLRTPQRRFRAPLSGLEGRDGRLNCERGKGPRGMNMESVSERMKTTAQFPGYQLDVSPLAHGLP